MKLFDVSVVGSINTDLSIFTNAMPSPGETVMGAEFIVGYGGKGANQTIAAYFLGAKVSFVAKIGEDDFGERYMQHLTAVGVDTVGVTQTKKANTGAAFITVEQGSGENQIVVVPGANMHLTVEDVNQADRAGIFQSRVLVCQLEVNAAATLHALKLAHSKGSITILNPAPLPHFEAVASEPAGFHDLLSSEVLGILDFCCPNETEAIRLVQIMHSNNNGANDNEELSSSNEPTSAVFSTCLRLLAEQGVRYPIVTLGAMGLIALIPPEEMPVEKPKDCTVIQNLTVHGKTKVVLHLAAPSIPDVVDTTGAGDCFVGALAYFVACHQSLGVVEQLRRSVWVASSSVRKAGTQSSYPKHTELPTRLFKSSVFQE